MNNDRGFWRELFSGSGRNNRVRYWQVTGLYLLVMLVMGAASVLMDSEPAVALLIFPILVLTIGGFVASVFNHVKRLHDVGLSGWWLLLSAAPMTPVALLRIADNADVQLLGAALQVLVSLGLLVLFGAIPGKTGPNRFGPQPGAPSTDEVFA